MEAGMGIGIGLEVEEESGTEESIMVSRMGFAREMDERSFAT